jgi:hypothetical protein
MMQIAVQVSGRLAFRNVSVKLLFLDKATKHIRALTRGHNTAMGYKTGITMTELTAA